MTPTIKLPSPATQEFWEIPVLYEDEQLLALNKPSGLPASPEAGHPEERNLLQLLHTGITEGKAWARERGLAYLMNAHRLDAEISGVLLLARQKPVLAALANLLGSGKPTHRFLALVQGAPAGERFEVEGKMATHPARPGFFRVDPRRGKRASTRFTVLERFSGWTLLACEPLTLRSHQIRAHLRQAGFPIAGDRLYGGKPLLLSSLKRGYRLKPNRVERPLLPGLGLHAEKVELAHPVTGAPLCITAPWPKDLTVAVKYLRRYAR